MKTSNSIHIIPAVLLVLSACTNDSLSPENGSEPARLRATFDADVAVTKSILVDNPGVKLESFWEAGEQIGVFGGNSGNVLFTLKAEDLSYDRKTADFTTGGSIPAGRLTGYSPYQKGAGSDGESIVIDFPAKQHYVTYNGVVQPDPAANILLGEGSKGSGLSFRNMTAVLKIGQAFETEKLIKTVEFRDLSGAAVSGTMKLTGGSHPKAEITGSGKVLTLDLGDGLEFPAGSMCPLFLIVPARDYAKGFEITFIDANGGKTVRTVGTTRGKTLERSVVYLIGDISGHSYPVESKTVLKDGATIMTPELLDKVTLIQTDEVWLRGPDGEVLYNEHGAALHRPIFNMIVHEGMHPEEGGYLIFDQPTSDLPEGGVYKIISCKDLGGGQYDVSAYPEANFAAPFEELTVGTPLYDETGALLKDGGIELDLSSHVKSVTDQNGNAISFSVGPSGELFFGEAETEALLGLSPDTKAMMSKMWTLPKMSFKHAEENAEVAFGAQLSINTKFAIGIMQGEMQYVHFTANPVFTLGADFTLKGEINKDWPFHLITLEFVPIVVAPGLVLVPQLKLSGKVGLGGTITFTSSVSYTYDMGTYGISYNKGDGFTARHEPPKPSKVELKPSLGGFSGSLYASAGVTASPNLLLYGVFGMGADMDFRLKFGFGTETVQDAIVTPLAYKLFLLPELEITPHISAIGYFYHKFTDLTTNLEFDPIWECYLTPVVKELGVMEPIGPTRSMEGIKYLEWDTDEYGNDRATPYEMRPQFYATTQTICTQVEGVYYHLISTKPTLDPWSVWIEVMTGTTDMPWSGLGLQHGGIGGVGGATNYWLLSSMYQMDSETGQISEKWHYTGVRTVARYEAMMIPAGSTDHTNKGKVGGKADFPEGKVRSLRYVLVNNATGTTLGDESGPDGEPLHKGTPFATYWPESPAGPYFIRVEMPYAYKDSKYPVGTPSSLKEPDGYYEGGYGE